MGSADVVVFCSFTKAIEHLGDRWSLLVVREIGVFGPQGFNDLARGLPGRVSRSVLAERLRRLQSLGIVAHDVDPTHGGRYQLTTAGEALLPIIMGLRGWAADWIPDDPAVLERDPDVVLAWLAARVDRAAQPHPRAVVEIWSGRHEEFRAWLVLEQGAEPYGCRHDPILEQQRYVVVRLGPEVLLALALWGSEQRPGSRPEPRPAAPSPVSAATREDERPYRSEPVWSSLERGRSPTVGRLPGWRRTVWTWLSCTRRTTTRRRRSPRRSPRVPARTAQTPSPCHWRRPRPRRSTTCACWSSALPPTSWA